MKKRKCKYCKSEFLPYTTLQKNCFDPDCVTAWINDVKTKQWTKKKAQLKKDLMTVQDYVKIAQQVFNKYIRLRDKGKPCIACGSTNMKKINASHFYSAGGHMAVRFDERNVHSGCEHCNTFLSGNLLQYRDNLLAKLGNDEFERLTEEAMKTRHYTREELKEIIDTYKKKIKEIEVGI